MTHDEIVEMPIENVQELEVENSRFGSISLDLNGINCWLGIYFSEHDNVYSPKRISYGGKRLCPYCNEVETYCPILDEQRKTIFERVIQSNSIRLNWLYREYKVR